jgi:hypothetical protein
LYQQPLKGVGSLLILGGADIERESWSFERPESKVRLIRAEAVRFNVSVGDEPAQREFTPGVRDNTRGFSE